MASLGYLKGFVPAHIHRGIGFKMYRHLISFFFFFTIQFKERVAQCVFILKDFIEAHVSHLHLAAYGISKV